MLILCVFLPPIAAGILGGFYSFLINLFLTCIGWLPGVIHAYFMFTNKEKELENNEEITNHKTQEVTKNDTNQKSIFNSFLGGFTFAIIIYSIYYFNKQ